MFSELAPSSPQLPPAPPSSPQQLLVDTHIYKFPGTVLTLTVQGLRYYLWDESVDKQREQVFDASDFAVFAPEDIPGQENSSDCGMFMCA